MTDDLPQNVRIEVKSSRTEDFTLSRRDIEGITPNGHAAVLLKSRHLKGPRWVLVPAHVLSPGAVNENQLSQLTEEEGAPTLLVEKLNKSWSDWVLDSGVQDLFFKQPGALKEAIEWCLKNHPARPSRFQGSVREGKLSRGLRGFQSRLDQHVKGDSGPKQEGFVHQHLLEDAFRQAGYQVTNNNIGVPDFSATLVAEHGMTGILEAWSPEDPTLRQMREQIRGLNDEQRAELFEALRESLTFKRSV